MSAKWWGREFNHLNPKAPERSGLGDYPPLGWVLAQNWCWLVLLWWFAVKAAWSPSRPSPWLCRGLWILWMEHQWVTLHGFHPPQGLCNFHEPGWQAQGTGVWHRLVWHKLPGWSFQHFCLCGGPHGCRSRPAFTVDCRQGSSRVGPAASGAALIGFM